MDKDSIIAFLLANAEVRREVLESTREWRAHLEHTELCARLRELAERRAEAAESEVARLGEELARVREERQPWYCVENDGSWNECATRAEAENLLQCASSGAYITPDKPIPADPNLRQRFESEQRLRARGTPPADATKPAEKP